MISVVLCMPPMGCPEIANISLRRLRRQCFFGSSGEGNLLPKRSSIDRLIGGRTSPLQQVLVAIKRQQTSIICPHPLANYRAPTERRAAKVKFDETLKSTNRINCMGSGFAHLRFGRPAARKIKNRGSLLRYFRGRGSSPEAYAVLRYSPNPLGASDPKERSSKKIRKFRI
jgi:hypothetical protein